MTEPAPSNGGAGWLAGHRVFGWALALGIGLFLGAAVGASFEHATRFERWCTNELISFAPLLQIFHAFLIGLVVSGVGTVIAVVAQSKHQPRAKRVGAATIVAGIVIPIAAAFSAWNSGPLCPDESAVRPGQIDVVLKQPFAFTVLDKAPANTTPAIGPSWSSLTLGLSSTKEKSGDSARSPAT